MQRLLKEFRARPKDFLWIDDVFITGILARRARIGHIAMNSAFALAAGSNKAGNKVIFAHVPGRKSGHEERRKLWRRIISRGKAKRGNDEDGEGVFLEMEENVVGEEEE